MQTRQTETITIEGMSCGHCVRAVEQALRAVPGVDVESVEIGSARVTYDEQVVDRSRLVRAIEEEGFSVA